MRQFCYKTWVKVCAMILCILSINAAAGSVFFMGAGAEFGVYRGTKEEIKEELFDLACYKYSIKAVTLFYQGDTELSDFEDSNFRYGIIQADSLEGIDLNDKKNYSATNFDQNVSEDMLYIFSCDLGDSTEFKWAESLLDTAYIYNQRESYRKSSIITGCYFVRDTGKFYCYAEGRLYPAIPEGDDYYIDRIEKDSAGEYCWTDQNDRIYFNGQSYYMSDIPILLNKDLPDIGEVVSELEEDSNYAEYQIEAGNVVQYSFEFQDTTPYYVLSYVRKPLQEAGNGLLEKLVSFGKQDMLNQVNTLVDILYHMRYAVFGIFAVSVLLVFLSFVALLTGAGHRNTKEAVPGVAEKVPFDVYTVLILVVGICFVEAAAAIYMITSDILLPSLFGIMIILLAEIAGLFYCMSFAVRIKTGILWKNTLCWRLWSWLAVGIKNSVKKIIRSLPLLWKAWVIMGALAFFEMIGLMASSYNTELQLALWFLEKVVLYGFLGACLFQMKKLQQAGEQLAEGRLNSKIDTGRMFWDFKKHGENLNNIRGGIQQAVAEQMKSEHFKTELITNVSHDIKTPLTSIINYVDLLEKEEIGNPTAQEYLEVLSRQSARLKKLIEDLMEASKASTGNLTVAWETCDAQVMLTQTIGEFEEKLKASQIELIVQGSKEPMVILADPRHLWRIFENLMNNICKYAQPSTRAYVNVEKREQQGKIIFRNISRYALNIDSEELMERFVRGDSSRNTEGSGLGLSIAKSLTELMHGTFELVVDGDLFKVILTFSVEEQYNKSLD